MNKKIERLKKETEKLKNQIEQLTIQEKKIKKEKEKIITQMATLEKEIKLEILNFSNLSIDDLEELLIENTKNIK